MRLTHIKLAGFKSFVDPTHISVPGALVGIVGPNGCGKSNIIDAVRWVLGESSARQLRGETMQDVIFNGSDQRKPMGRASVELIFDNSLGKAAGQWSQYAEISIKRVLQRDGESSYYINNIHVRRRDIADIFLGTGLGGRAYAIIEQGMISRIIEARPEELRIFLEEAAGVSKYRERRRETELRLKDAKENLLRVDDIRNELQKQLEHLEAQAQVANEYRRLESELNTSQQLLWLLKKQEAAASRARVQRDIEKISLELEATTASLRDAEQRLEQLRSQHYESSDRVHAAQGELYESNSEVARLEQQLQHLRENRARVENQIASLNQQLAHQTQQRNSAESALSESRQAAEMAQEQYESLNAEAQEHAQKLPQTEAMFNSLRSKQEQAKRVLAQIEQTLQVEQARLMHLERALEQLAQRRQRLADEKQNLPVADEPALNKMRAELDQLVGALEEKRARLRQQESEFPLFEAAHRETMQTVEQATQQLTNVEARLSALQQLQARVTTSEQTQAWLEQRGLLSLPRLWQNIRIEPGWEDALEAVLRERLNSIALTGGTALDAWLAEPPPGKISMYEPVDASTHNHETSAHGLVRLANYVSCTQPETLSVIEDWLHEVYVVQESAQALSLRAQLAEGAMLVSREGHIFSRHSISFHAPDSEIHGVLSRQREIETLEQDVTTAQAELEQKKDLANSKEQAFVQHRSEIDVRRQEVAQLQAQQHQLHLEVVRQTEAAQRISSRSEQIERELREIEQQHQHESDEKSQILQKITEHQAQQREVSLEVEQSGNEYQAAEQNLRIAREQLQKAQHQAQEARFHKQTCENKINEIENNLNVINDIISNLKRDIDNVSHEQQGYDESEVLKLLQQVLTVRQQREQALAEARSEYESAEHKLKETDQERMSHEQKLYPLRDRISDLKLKEQEARLFEEQYAEQLISAGADEAQLVGNLEKGMRSSALQNEINRLSQAMTDLGAVNLAALEELQSGQERKTYLDSQSQDLNQAVETLEQAIKHIDKETRERLLETFDEVNKHLGEMFPALFAGGHAKLVLTGEEILDSGVQVIAQPPGKKNSSIHLLSGGEKALTALSLVFSLFQLNPAPFCLLDEVDAPLDDTNTERYCELVKKMSAQTQFLFISHNKITMEMANQLVGITMQEQGVSRVVAVDIEEALRLREEETV